MPLPDWLHVNGVRLSNEIHQDQQLTPPASDQLIDDVEHPGSISSIPSSTIIIDGQYHSRQYPKFEHTDLPKKLYIDRQIKKAKSLPGLIKGTALSRQTPLNSASVGKITSSNPLANANVDDSKPISVDDNPDDLQTHHLDRTTETRRPRVYFADVNRVQFFEDNTDDFEQSIINTKLRRSRHRSSKKSSALLVTNPISPPPIQHSQSLYNSHSSSRQQSIKQEFNIKKQQLISSPRTHSSRITHLPDILNQSLPNDTPIKEKYVLQREKPLLRFAESTAEQSVNSSAEISRESTRAGGMRQSVALHPTDSSLPFESDESGGLNTFTNNSFMSSILTSRTRPSLHTISLRQQFISGTKSKLAGFSNSTNPRRTASMKLPISRMHSADEENVAMQNHHEPILASHNRPMTSVHASKRSNRNYVVHFNGKPVCNGTAVIESTELTDQHAAKANLYESSQDRLPNSLNILRPPYLIHETNKKHADESVRSSRTTSTRRSYEFQGAVNTIAV